MLVMLLEKKKGKMNNNNFILETGKTSCLVAT